MGESLRTDVDALNNTNFHTPHVFGLWVAPSFDDPAKNQGYLMQGGLGLPDRDYYLKTDPKMVEVQTKYRQHIAAVLKLAGVADADARASRIYDLEEEDRAGACHARRLRGRAQGRQPLGPSASLRRKGARVIDWMRPSSRRRASDAGQPDAGRCGSPARSPSIAAIAGRHASRSRCGRTG